MRMKKADMRAAIESGVTVAVASYSYRDEVPSHARKAVIVGLDAKRHVSSGRRDDWHGHLVEDGVRVRFEEPVESDTWMRPIVSHGWRDTKHEQDTEDCVVGPHLVLGTWDEYAEALAKQERARQEKKERAQSAEADSKELASRLTDLGFKADADYHIPPSRGYTPGYWRGLTLSRSVARELVQYLESTRG